MSSRDHTSFLDARQNQLQLELAAGDGIDAKALGLLASNLAVLIFIGQSTLSLHSWQVIGLVVTFFVSLSFAVLAIWPRHYPGASVSLYDHPEYLQLTTVRLVNQLIADTEVAILQIKQINKVRWYLCATSLIIMVGASLPLFGLLYFKV